MEGTGILDAYCPHDELSIPMTSALSKYKRGHYLYQLYQHITQKKELDQKQIGCSF